jgi:hypothetical protein
MGGLSRVHFDVSVTQGCSGLIEPGLYRLELAKSSTRGFSAGIDLALTSQRRVARSLATSRSVIRSIPRTASVMRGVGSVAPRNERDNVIWVVQISRARNQSSRQGVLTQRVVVAEIDRRRRACATSDSVGGSFMLTQSGRPRRVKRRRTLDHGGKAMRSTSTEEAP